MEDISAWLTLKSVPGIGNLLYNRLLSRFKTPAAVLGAGMDALAAVEGMSPRLARAIRRQQTPARVLREIDETIRRGFAFVTRNSPDYPPMLRHIPDPPPVLCVYGNLRSDDICLAVVGSRRCTHYGRSTTRKLCSDLAGHGLTVVSGLARGIDTAAHEGALEGGGRTIAVLGTGLSCIYPPENAPLFHRIAENGAVISEFSLDAQPEPHHFPIRNRIISGMSLGTVVVEAARRSGSLITARLAAEQGREVFAVPGSIHAATARGTHDLIKQGAKLVESVTDIIEELPMDPADTRVGRTSDESGHRVPPQLTRTEQAVYDAIGCYPAHIDELLRKLSMDSASLNAALLQLELKGLVWQEPGKFFIRQAGDIHV